MRTLILIILLLAGCSGQIHTENDYFAYLNKNDDKYFTNGVKFSYHNRGDIRPIRETYSLGQNIYTPSKKHSDALPSELSSNRPYGGWLYAEYRRAVLEENSKLIWGFQAGCSGRCSYAKETQEEVHKLLGQAYPTWDRNYSLKSEPGIILEREKYYELYLTDLLYSDYFARLKLGNIVDSVSFGASFKYGVNFTAFDPEAITFKRVAKEDPWSYYFFGEAEARAVPYNHFLEGSLFQDERHRVDGNLLVGEANLGFRVGYENFKFSYNYTVISDEWEGQNGPFFFGGLDLTW